MLSLPFRFLFALLIGAIIGLERESSRNDSERETETTSAGGIRTYALISLLGGLAGFFYLQNMPMMFLLLSAFAAILVLLYYAIGSSITKHFGMTSEISILITYILGFLAMFEGVSTQLVVILLVVTLLILSLKSKTHKLVNGISPNEIRSFISYALIALVVLPILPNTPVTLSKITFLHDLLQSYGVDLGQFATLEIFNPRKVWFVVALVTGIDVFGYILAKLVGGKKSFTLTSFVAGFISSTSATAALARKSNKASDVRPLVGSALLANMASFFQIFLLVGPVNGAFLVSLTPTLLAIIFASAGCSVYFLSRKEKSVHISKETEKEPAEREIFALKPALKFAALLIIVKLVTKISLILFGNSGFMVSSVIASVAGIDAILINLADLVGKGITIETGILTFILVNATNLLTKSLLSYLNGGRAFAKKFFACVLIVIAASLIGFFLK